VGSRFRRGDRHFGTLGIYVLVREMFIGSVFDWWLVTGDSFNN
jgi:hypothetical protein